MNKISKLVLLTLVGVAFTYNVYPVGAEELVSEFMELQEAGTKQQWAQWAAKMKKALFLGTKTDQTTKEITQYAQACECATLTELLKQHDLLAKLNEYINAGSASSSSLDQGSSSTAQVDSVEAIRPEYIDAGFSSSLDQGSSSTAQVSSVQAIRDDRSLTELTLSFYAAQEEQEKKNLERQILARLAPGGYMREMLDIEQFLNKNHFTVILQNQELEAQHLAVARDEYFRKAAWLDHVRKK